MTISTSSSSQPRARISSRVVGKNAVSSPRLGARRERRSSTRPMRGAYSVFPWPGTSRQPTANVRETRKIRRSHRRRKGGRKSRIQKVGFRLSCGSEAGSTLCDLGHLPEHVSRRTQPGRGGAGIWENYVERRAVSAFLRFLTTEGDDSLVAVADRLCVGRTAPTEFTRDCRGSRTNRPPERRRGLFAVLKKTQTSVGGRSGTSPFAMGTGGVRSAKTGSDELRRGFQTIGMNRELVRG